MVQKTFRINELDALPKWHTLLLTADEVQLKMLFAHLGGHDRSGID